MAGRAEGGEGRDSNHPSMVRRRTSFIEGGGEGGGGGGSGGSSVSPPAPWQTAPLSVTRLAQQFIPTFISGQEEGLVSVARSTVGDDTWSPEQVRELMRRKSDSEGGAVSVCVVDFFSILGAALREMARVVDSVVRRGERDPLPSGHSLVCTAATLFAGTLEKCVGAFSQSIFIRGASPALSTLASGFGVSRSACVCVGGKSDLEEVFLGGGEEDWNQPGRHDPGEDTLNALATILNDLWCSRSHLTELHEWIMGWVMQQQGAGGNHTTHHLLPQWIQVHSTLHTPAHSNGRPNGKHYHSLHLHPSQVVSGSQQHSEPILLLLPLAPPPTAQQMTSSLGRAMSSR